MPKSEKGARSIPRSTSGRGVTVGDNTTLYPGVKIYEGCAIGANCILHAGAVIGADGFGFMPNAAGGFDKIPQLGNVIIEDDVEIGANTCIDRAKTDSTIIRRGVKLDNLIQIGHNVQIGENTVSSAQTGIAGTSRVGRNCFLAGQVGIADHVTIGDRVKVGSKSGIDKNVGDDEIRFRLPRPARNAVPPFGGHLQEPPRTGAPRRRTRKSRSTNSKNKRHEKILHLCSLRSPAVQLQPQNQYVIKGQIGWYEPHGLPLRPGQPPGFGSREGGRIQAKGIAEEPRVAVLRDARTESATFVAMLLLSPARSPSAMIPTAPSANA